MIGAIAGDVIGSTYEHTNVHHMGFDLFPDGSRFTDDTVMTLALADTFVHGRRHFCQLIGGSMIGIPRRATASCSRPGQQT